MTTKIQHELDQPHIALRFFWLFILTYTVIWSFGPLLTRSSLPHDTLESISWGMQWQWGYNKHPFLAAWLSAGMNKLLGAVEWPVYLLAQLSVATTFIATYFLGRKILPSSHAMIAALGLGGVLYYNINSFNVDPDSLQSPLWALLALFLYQAITTQLLRYWLVTGLLLALCIVTKYQVVLFLLPMSLFCLVNVKARVSFFKPGLYLALAFMLILISPHIYWLWQHDFVTVRYALGAPYDFIRVQAHLVNLLHYLLDCFVYVVGLFLLLWPFYKSERDTFTVSQFSWQFLLFLGVGPCLLTALLTFISGDKAPSRWSTPYFFLLGIIVIAWLKPKLSSQSLRQFMITLIALSGMLWGGRMGSLMFHTRSNSDAYLPNKAIAEKLTQLWHERYSTPLDYIGGTHYLVATTTPYAADKPVPYLSLDQKTSPWVNEAAFIQHGGMIVWDEGVNYFWDPYSPKMETLSVKVRQRFPNLISLGSYTFYRTTPKLLPVTIGVAILPPQDSIS